MQYEIVFGPDFIQIMLDGKEVLYWTEDEWIEDPSVVYSIGNAINLACEGTTSESVTKSHESSDI